MVAGVAGWRALLRLLLAVIGCFDSCKWRCRMVRAVLLIERHVLFIEQPDLLIEQPDLLIERAVINRTATTSCY